MKKTIYDLAAFMAVSAKTAPKARGVDNLVIKIIGRSEIKKLMHKMQQIAKKNKRPSIARDAKNLKDISCCLLIGTKIKPLGLNCGFCGFPNCQQLALKKGICIYNPLDLGIALGSAVSTASDFHIDNRIMYSIGKAAVALKILGKEVRIAFGIPLSAAGKNPFFDRKQ